MESIPCEKLEALSGTKSYGLLREHMRRYRSSAMLSAALSLVFFPVVLVFTALAFIFVQFLALMVMGILHELLAGVVSELLGQLITDIVLWAFFFVAEIILIAPFGAMMVVFLFMLAQSFRGVTSREPNVARKLDFAANLDEVNQLTLPNRLVKLLYDKFIFYWDNSFGRYHRSLNTETFLRTAYNKNGSLVVTTGAKTLPLNSLYRAPSVGYMSSQWLTIELIEEGGHFVMVVIVDPTGLGGGANPKVEAIVIVDKKYKPGLLEKMKKLYPQAIKGDDNGSKGKGEEGH